MRLFNFFVAGLRSAPSTYTHDYVRNGTATLFAALNTLEGTVFGRCAPRHRHQEFIAFLDQIEKAVTARQSDPRHHGQLCPLRLPLHTASLCGASGRLRPQASRGAGLAGRQPALDVPLHADIVLLAERRRGLLLQADPQALRRGVFRSLDDLVATIERYVAQANDDPKPFRWTASATSIMAKLKMHRPKESEH